MFKVVVWGTGGRGKKAAEILGTNRIIAFIDSNPEKIGKSFYGKPIIDFLCYKKNYSEYAILVSIVAEKVITSILIKENIFYFSYNECPPELIGYGWSRAKKYVGDFDIPEKKVAVYGHTLFSLLVYEFLVCSGYECIGLICHEDLKRDVFECFHKLFPFVSVKSISDIEKDTTILQTISDYDCDLDLSQYNVRNIYDWKDKISDYFNSGIAAFKKRYKGKRCFVVATGPSLTFQDLDILRKNHEFCISVNTIFCCFNETKWRPDQYVAVDVDIITNFDTEIRRMDVQQKFISDASIEFNYDNLTDEFYIYHSIFTKDTIEKGLITDDFSKYAYNSGTVTAVALQLAMYEGFEEIYLLGCDCSYLYTGLEHFNEPEKMQIKEFGVDGATKEMLNYHISSYQKIKEYAESRGIKIYNATRGGYLEVYERIEFDKLFKHEV